MTFAVGLAATAAALACGAIALASRRALVRTGNASISWFVAGFAVLGAKSAAKAWLAFVDAPDSQTIETVFSLADLLAVALVAWPILTGGRRA